VRIVVGLLIVGLLAGGVVVLVGGALTPPPVATRLAGVTVAVGRPVVTDLDGTRHRLALDVTVSSTRDVSDCLAFALDNPFRDRVMPTADGTCLRPHAGTAYATLTFDRLSDDDTTFAAHTLLWGVSGGRCGPLFELLGVCVVDRAGTIRLELPTRSPLPSFGPIGSLVPVFSGFSFDP
jgi:hypothetical protein